MALSHYNYYVGLLMMDTYQMSLTNPRDALHQGNCAANKGGCSM